MVRGLRKDYAYLFERFFYFLEDNAAREQGIVVFDELEKSQSHLLIDQMHRYFAGHGGWSAAIQAASSPSPSSCTAILRPACRLLILSPTSSLGAFAYNPG